MNRKPATWPAALAFIVIAAVAGFSFFGGQLQALASAASSTPSGAAYELHTVKSQSGLDVVAGWNGCQDAITYKVNLAGVPAADKAATTATIKASFAKLAQATGMTYRFKGATSFVPGTKNLAKAPAEIVVAAVDFAATDLDTDESTLGFGGTVTATWTKNSVEGAAVVRGYVVLDPAAFAGLDRGFGAGTSQGNVVLHELGHASGLEHSGTGNLMNATLTGASPAGFSAGDLAGLAKVGVKAGCITIPTGAGLTDLN